MNKTKIIAIGPKTNNKNAKNYIGQVWYCQIKWVS